MEKEKGLLSLLTLCADDFGLNSAVNLGITKLVKAGRLNAVSCMAGAEAFAQGLPALIDACEAAPLKVEIGLHLTLTEYRPLGRMKKLASKEKLPTVAALLLKSHLGLLDAQELRDELSRQWEQFIAVVGQKPDFIDGHQHIHLLPQIRECVVDLAKTEFQDEGWVRSCYTPLAPLAAKGHSSLRLRIISHLAKHMVQLLAQAQIETNSYFYGINNFNKNEDFKRLMQDWVTLAKEHEEWAVIMCHPGQLPHEEGAEEGFYDPIKARRADELEALLRRDYLNN